MQNDHSTKAILLTAHSDKSFLFKAIPLKLVKYLVKPVTRKDLNEALGISIKELENYNVVSLEKIELTENYSWNIKRKEVNQHNTIINLTNKEKILLELLFSHKNCVKAPIPGPISKTNSSLD